MVIDVHQSHINKRKCSGSHFEIHRHLMLNPKILRQWYNSISLNKYFAYNDLIMSGAEPELELLSTNIHNTERLVKGSTFAGEYERLCICSAASKEHLQQKAFRFEVEVFRSTYIT